MKRSQIVLFVILAVLGGLVWALVLRNPPAPFLPADEDHAASADLSGCVDCHGADGAAPRSKKHPLGNDCFRCHARR